MSRVGALKLAHFVPALVLRKRGCIVRIVAIQQAPQIGALPKPAPTQATGDLIGEQEPQLRRENSASRQPPGNAANAAAIHPRPPTFSLT